MKTNEWARRLAYVTGLANQQLLLLNEYLAAENHSASAAPKRSRLTDSQRCTLAEIGKRWPKAIGTFFAEATSDGCGGWI
jgi:hypothetical protein